MVQTARQFPLDLAVVLGLIVLVDSLFLVPAFGATTVVDASIQTFVAIPFLLFVPGYVLVAILAPSTGGDVERSEATETDRSQGIDWPERIALSFGTSVALVPIFGLGMGTVWSFSTAAVITGIELFLLPGVAIAFFRRLRTPPDNRYRTVSFRRITQLHQPELRLNSVANVVLAIAVLLAFGSVGYAVATPYASSSSSTLYLATENETGSLVASEYPTTFTAGEGETLVVGVRNSEERRQQYTVVIATERVRTAGTGTNVTEDTEVDRLSTTVSAGGEWTSSHAVIPEMTGENLRLHYYLYRGETAPPDPDSVSAYRDAYIWINVSSP